MAIDKIISIDVEDGNSPETIQQLIDLINDLTKEVDQYRQELKKAEDDIEDLGKKSKQAGKDGQTGMGLFSRGIKGIGTAIKAAGIGVFLALLGTFFEILQNNQKVVDTFNTYMNTAQVLFNEFTSVLSDAYDKVVQLEGGFDNLIAVIKGSLTIAFTPLKLAFYTIEGAILTAQLAWEQSFLGNNDPMEVLRLQTRLLEVGEDIKQVAVDAVDAGKAVVTNFSGAISEVATFTEEVVEGTKNISVEAAIAQGKALTNLQKNSAIAEAAQEVLLKKYEIQAERQRQIRDDENLSIEDRIKANDKLGVILDKQEEAMLKQAKAQVIAAQAAYDANQTDENRIALLQAQANALDVVATVEGFRSEQLVNSTQLMRENLDMLQSREEGINQIATDRAEFLNNLDQNETRRIENALALLDVEKEIELQRLQNVIDSTTAGTQARVDAEQAWAEANEGFFQREVELQIQRVDSHRAYQEAIVDASIQALGAAKGIAKEGSDLQKAIIIAEQIAQGIRLGMRIADTISFQATEASKTTAAATGAMSRSVIAVAEGTAQTAKIGFPQNIPMLIGYAAQAAGIIAAIVSATKSSKENVPSAPSSAIPQVSAPSFNVIGTTNATTASQGATTQAVQETNDRPIQTYVISSQADDRLAMDREIAEAGGI